MLFLLRCNMAVCSGTSDGRDGITVSNGLFDPYLVCYAFPCIITCDRTGYGTVCLHVHVCECGHGFHCEIIYVL